MHIMHDIPIRRLVITEKGTYVISHTICPHSLLSTLKNVDKPYHISPFHPLHFQFQFHAPVPLTSSLLAGTALSPPSLRLPPLHPIPHAEGLLYCRLAHGRLLQGGSRILDCACVFLVFFRLVFLHFFFFFFCCVCLSFGFSRVF